MGLDITVYRRLAPAPEAPVDADGFPTDYEKYWLPGPSLEWSEKTFSPPRAPEIDAKTIYLFAESFGFRAGSYGGHSAFRDWLARLVGHPSAQALWTDGKVGGPFYELVNFADNEGVIGPAVAAKLAKDFAEHEGAAKARGEAEPGYVERYMLWKKACETAADGGAINFH